MFNVSLNEKDFELYNVFISMYDVASMMINTDHDLLKKMDRINKIKNDFAFKEIYSSTIEEDGTV